MGIVWRGLAWLRTKIETITYIFFYSAHNTTQPVWCGGGAPCLFVCVLVMRNEPTPFFTNRDSNTTQQPLEIWLEWELEEEKGRNKFYVKYKTEPTTKLLLKMNKYLVYVCLVKGSGAGCEWVASCFPFYSLISSIFKPGKLKLGKWGNGKQILSHFQLTNNNSRYV